MAKKNKLTERPTKEELKAELRRVKYAERYMKSLKSTIYTLVTVAAITVLIATVFLPVLQIYGTSMTPTLQDGNIVVSSKHSKIEKQDVVAFYYNNKILVKRVIAVSGEWVDIEDDGTVYVNSIALEEPYISEKSQGDCDIKMPYQVPEGKIFVMGDHREISVDSRNKSIGCISEEHIVGRLVYRVWPLNQLGKII